MRTTINLQLSLTNLGTQFDFEIFESFLRDEARHRFANAGVKTVLFIPYAYDGNDYNGFISHIKNKIFDPLGIIVNVLSQGDPVQLIDNAEGIVIGGNDLGRLLLGTQNLYGSLRKRLNLGIPYLSWNAGSVFVSPKYLEQPVIPINTDCLNVVENQQVCHFIDTISNRLTVETFLTNYQYIPRVVCMLDSQPLVPDGSGLRYEDDDAGLVYTPIPGTIPPIAFENSEFGFIQV